MTPCDRCSAASSDARGAAPICDPPPMRDVPIRGDEIGLGQLLKFVGVAESGGAARALLDDGVVRVNGEPESRRGRRLHDGDVVEVEGEDALRVVGGG